jgi:predicted DNA-binding transcriptional regulator YafY
VTPDRFFTLMLLLESRDGATTQELAAALGVSLRTITRDLNWLRDAGLPVTAHRGRLGGVTMLPGSGLDLTRLTPGERDHLSLTGLDDKQRAELNASVESRRALAKIAATRSRRVHGLLPLTDVVHVDSRPWLQTGASGTTPASLIGPVRRGRRLRIEYASPRESRPRDLVVDPYGKTHMFQSRCASCCLLPTGSAERRLGVLGLQTMPHIREDSIADPQERSIATDSNAGA